jgi:hypothetical protein
MNETSYKLLPGTPRAEEDYYRDNRARENRCKGCDVPKDICLRDLIRNYCQIGLCPQDE